MRVFRFLAAIVAVGLLFGLAGALFQTGYLAGASAGGGAVAVPVVGYGWGFFPFGFIGGIFHFLGTIFLFILLIGLLRAVFFGGRRGGHGPWGHGPRGSWGRTGDPEHMGPWMDRAREVHDEWHRRDADPAPRSSAGGSQGGTPSGPA